MGIQEHSRRFHHQRAGEDGRQISAFKESFEKRRCLVPADGFIEWPKEGKPPKQPYYLTLRYERPFSIAGIWNDEGFVVITTEPNSILASFHDRMPVILVGDKQQEWLETANKELLQPYPANDMQIWPVSKTVNKVAGNNREELLRPVSEEKELF